MEEKLNPPLNDSTNQNSEEKSGIKRRDILKGLAALPIFGVFVFQLMKKLSHDRQKKNAILSELGIGEKAPAVLPKTTMRRAGELVRLGIVGFGARGEQLSRAVGFAHPDWIEARNKAAARNKLDKGLEDWLEQDDLNVVITGVCDVFDDRAERGLIASKGEIRPDGAPPVPNAKRYRRYQEMLESEEIDAVIIATPDFHHARMTIDAVNAGKHVYCEKCMTRTEEEVFRVEEAVKRGRVVFQLGHQYPQNACYAKAKEIVEKNILGRITLVETTTNRNTEWGAWIRHLDDEGHPNPGSSETIDWDQLLGSRPRVAFSIDRYYNWSKWWDYATGLSGQLLCHEYDAVNQILGLGIPKSCTASGGIYYFKDNREIPDTFQAVFEFPDRDLTLIYSATLASSRFRGRVFMGHDASMEVGNILKVTADRDSTRFREKIRSGVIDPSYPLFSYRPGQREIDAVTSATEEYFATRGLIYTYRDGRRVDMAHLHIGEWLDAIRNGSPVSCPIEKGVEVTIACHMATRSFREKRRVEWDSVKRRIV